MSIKEKIIQISISISVISLLLTMNYKFYIPGVSLAELLLIFNVLIIIFFKKIRFSFLQIRMLIFWIFCFLLTLISIGLQGMGFDLAVFSRLIRASFIIVSVVLISSTINFNYLLKIYKAFVILSIVFLLSQFILNLMNIHLVTKILPFEYYDPDFVYNPYNKEIFRPAGFFAEPSHLSQFLIPGILLSVFGWDNKYKSNYLLLFFILISIVITTSTNGLVIGIAVLFLSIFYKYRTNILKRIIKIIVISIIFVTILIILKPNVMMYTINKLDFSNINPGSSEGFRIFRGIAVYRKLPFEFKLFGIGHGNLSNYVFKNKLYTIYDPLIMNDVSADYASGLSLSFIYYGLLLGLAYIFILFKSSKTIESRIILFSYLIFSLTSSTLFDTMFVFYIVFVFALNNYGNYGTNNDKFESIPSDIYKNQV